MKKKIKSITINSSQNQLHLFGYESYFIFFQNLFEKNLNPKTILLSGLKGTGKATFIYHFINYLFSSNEKQQYSTRNFLVDEENISYGLIKLGIHPNFFLVEKKPSDNEIKVDQIKLLLKFLSKSTYSKGLKVVMINDTEYLNLSASNALLKAIEEPGENTIFFLIHNNSFSLLNTIKSRCVEFRISFNTSEKISILKKLIIQYDQLSYNKDIESLLYFESPGNLLKYTASLLYNNLDILNDHLLCISFLIENYKIHKSPDNLSSVSLFIENYYNYLCLNNINLHRTFFNRDKILNLIADMKKFNLSDKSVLIYIQEVLFNEKK